MKYFFASSVYRAFIFIGLASVLSVPSYAATFNVYSDGYRDNALNYNGIVHVADEVKGKFPNPFENIEQLEEKSADSDFEMLKQQNKSLRDTIRAQNEMLSKAGANSKQPIEEQSSSCDSKPEELAKLQKAVEDLKKQNASLLMQLANASVVVSGKNEGVEQKTVSCPQPAVENTKDIVDLQASNTALMSQLSAERESAALYQQKLTECTSKANTAQGSVPQGGAPQGSLAVQDLKEVTSSGQNIADILRNNPNFISEGLVIRGPVRKSDNTTTAHEDKKHQDADELLAQDPLPLDQVEKQ